MPRFDKGVSYYTRARVPVYFPEDAVCCRYCPMMRADAAGARHVCVMTGLILPTLDTTPTGCPIKIDQEVCEDG